MPGPGPARILKGEDVKDDQETRAVEPFQRHPSTPINTLYLEMLDPSGSIWIHQDLHKNMWDANTPGTSRNKVVFTVFAAPRCKFAFMWIVEGFSGTFTWHEILGLPLDN